VTDLDPVLLAALTDLVKGLESLGSRFCVIGALVPQFLLDEPPRRFTNDADAVAAVETPEEFERLKEQLRRFHFSPTRRRPFRLQHDAGGVIDILPYSDTIAPDDTLRLGSDLTFNVVGFSQLFDSAVVVETHGLTIPVAPIPLYVLLKLAAYKDRSAPKDLASVLHCFRYYEEDSERRYGLEHDGEAVPFEFTTAFMLGQDARPFAKDALARVASEVLAELRDIDSVGVDRAAREEGRLHVEPEHQEEIVALFGWFQKGVGL
jgi:predicted nucleotidyltransferase